MAFCCKYLTSDHTFSLLFKSDLYKSRLNNFTICWTLRTQQIIRIEKEGEVLAHGTTKFNNPSSRLVIDRLNIKMVRRVLIMHSFSYLIIF